MPPVQESGITIVKDSGKTDDTQEIEAYDLLQSFDTISYEV